MSRFLIFLAVGLGGVFVYAHYFIETKSTNIDERISYWQEEIARGLPSDSSKSSTIEFFSQRGVQLRCCFSAKKLVGSHGGVDQQSVDYFGKQKIKLLILVPLKDDALAGAVDFTTVTPAFSSTQ